MDLTAIQFKLTDKESFMDTTNIHEAEAIV